MNDADIRDANHDDAAKAFKLAGNNVQLLVQYNFAEFNSFQVNYARVNTCTFVHVQLIHVFM